MNSKCPRSFWRSIKTCLYVSKFTLVFYSLLWFVDNQTAWPTKTWNHQIDFLLFLRQAEYVAPTCLSCYFTCEANWLQTHKYWLVSASWVLFWMVDSTMPYWVFQKKKHCGTYLKYFFFQFGYIPNFIHKHTSHNKRVIVWPKKENFV